MAPEDLTPHVVRDALHAIRLARPLKDSPLLDLDALAVEMRAEHLSDTRESRRGLLPRWLATITWRQLARLRGDDPATRSTTLSAEQHEAQLQADFQANSIDREMWGLLYFRTFSGSALTLQQLSQRVGVSIRTLRRRIDRGYRALAETLREEERDADVSLAAGHGIPELLTPFIGRERELADVRGLLGRHRLVTLTGPGGIGKSRLAMQVARGLAAEFDAGAWYVEMASITEERSVPGAIVTALGLREEGGRSATDIILHFLAGKSLLLVLDNCEHLVEACSTLVRQVVTRCPQVRLLATSREELHLDGQAVFVVPQMALPDESALATADTVSRYDAIRLFAARASIAQRGFTIRDDNAAQVARVCRHLEGIPLAIELAAARVPFLSLDQLETRLAKRFQVLQDGRRAFRPGHESMAATIAWSYELLPPVQQSLLKRLSVFRGGWTLEAVEAVCVGEGIETEGMLELLVDLAAKSLIDVRQSQPAPRYGMLETVRQFVEQVRTAPGERRRWRRQHLEHFVGYAERVAPEIQGPDAGRWADRLNEDHQNLIEACRSAIELGLAEQGLRLGKALGNWWIMSGRYDEALEMLTALVKVDPAADVPRLRGEALRYASWSAKIHGDVPRAQALLEEALVHARRSGDDVAVGHVLDSQASLAHDQGDLEAATSKAREGIRHFRRGGASSRAMAGGKDTLATLLCDQGGHAEARQLYLECLEAHRELEDANAMASVLNNLAVLEEEMGNDRESQRYYREARELYKETGHRAGLAITNLNLGLVALNENDHALALQRFEESLADFRELKHSEGVRMALMQAANARQHFDDYDTARRYLDELLSQVGEHNNPIATGQALTCYAGLEIDCCAPLRGARLIGAAEAAYTLSGAVPEPSEVKRRGMMLDRAGKTLDEETLKRAVAEGRAVTMGEAVDYALGTVSWEALASG